MGLHGCSWTYCSDMRALSFHGLERLWCTKSQLQVAFIHCCLENSWAQWLNGNYERQRHDIIFGKGEGTSKSSDYFHDLDAQCSRVFKVPLAVGDVPRHPTYRLFSVSVVSRVNEPLKKSTWPRAHDVMSRRSKACRENIFLTEQSCWFWRTTGTKDLSENDFDASLSSCCRECCLRSQWLLGEETFFASICSFFCPWI